MIVFVWWGFPQYAARCVGALVKSTTEKVIVVATRPEVPVEGMERAAGCHVVWVEAKDGLFDCSDCSIGRLGADTTLIVSGWFNALRDRVRAAGGGLFA